MVLPRCSARAVKPTGAREITLISLFLVAITWLVFSQTVGYDFVNYDDHVYVYQNPVHPLQLPYPPQQPTSRPLHK